MRICTLVLVPVFALVSLGYVPYHFGSVPAQPSSMPIIQSSAWINIRQLWARKFRRLSKHSQDAPQQNVDIMLDLLDRAPKDQVDAELERIRNLSIDYARISGYDLTLLQALVVRLRYRREGDGFKLKTPEDKERIVYLLSGKCPLYIATVPIELFLTINSSDNILLLFDSHEKSTNKDTQRTILEALSRDLKKLRQEHKNDKDFLSTSKEWFLANRTKLKVNPYYIPNGLSTTTIDLFLSKECLYKHR